MGKEIDKEKRIVAQMITLYARYHRHEPGIEQEMENLRVYCMARLEHCRWGEGKPACQHCQVHCYAPEKRERIRQVMRWAGPRMLWHHPGAVLWHLFHHREPKEIFP